MNYDIDIVEKKCLHYLQFHWLPWKVNPVKQQRNIYFHVKNNSYTFLIVGNIKQKDKTN